MPHPLGDKMISVKTTTNLAHVRALLATQVEAPGTTTAAKEKWSAWYGTAADQLTRNKTY